MGEPHSGYGLRPPGTRIAEEGIRPRHYSIAGKVEALEREARPYFRGTARNRAHQFSRLYGEFLKSLAAELIAWGEEHTSDDISIRDFDELQRAAKKVYKLECELLAIQHQVADTESLTKELKAKLAAAGKLQNQTPRLGVKK